MAVKEGNCGYNIQIKSNYIHMNRNKGNKLFPNGILSVYHKSSQVHLVEGIILKVIGIGSIAVYKLFETNYMDFSIKVSCWAPFS